MASSTEQINVRITGHDNTGRAWQSATRRVRRHQRQMQGYTRVLRNAKTQLVQMNASLGAMPAAALAGVTAGFVALLKAVTTVGMKMDGFTNSMIVSTGTLAGAQLEIRKIRELTDTLGLNFMSTADAYKKFAIAASEVGMEAKSADRIFNSVAKASAAMGLSAENTRLTLKALEQMISKGTVQSEELRGQLGEHLPGAFGMAAKAMGVTTAELSKMLEQGKVLAIDLLPKLADVLENKFAKVAIRASEQTSAKVNRMSNSWKRLLESFSKTRAFESLKSGLDSVTAGLKSVTQWIQMGGIDTFLDDIERELDFFVYDLLGVVNSVRVFVYDVVKAFSEIKSINSIIDTVILGALTLSKAVISGFRMIGSGLKSFANGVGYVLKSISKLSLSFASSVASTTSKMMYHISNLIMRLYSAMKASGIDDSIFKGATKSVGEMGIAIGHAAGNALVFAGELDVLNDKIKHFKGDNGLAKMLGAFDKGLQGLSTAMEKLKVEYKESGGASLFFAETLSNLHAKTKSLAAEHKAYLKVITEDYARKIELSEATRELNIEITKLQELMAEFKPDPESSAVKQWWELNFAAAAFEKELKAITLQAGTLEEQTAQFMDRFVDDWSTRLVDGIAAGKASMADFAKSTLKMIGQMIVKALLWRAVMGLAKVATNFSPTETVSNISSFFEPTPSLLSQMTPFTARESTPSLVEELFPMPEMKAKGGSVSSRTPYIVGERGAELFVPRSSGTIVPNNKLGSSQQDNSSLNITFQINAVDTQSGTAFLMKNQKSIVGMIDQAYRKQGRTGVTA